MRSPRLLRVVVPVLVLGLLGVGVAAFASRGTPATDEPIAVAPTPPVAAVSEEVEPEPKSPLERKLGKHPVVVVALYSPDSAVDALATREARAGAQAAGVGFLAVDVTDEAAVSPLTTLIDAREAPALVVFQRGLEIATLIGGYVDRETVAQAAENALL
jgi:hypothetical protein